MNWAAWGAAGAGGGESAAPAGVLAGSLLACSMRRVRTCPRASQAACGAVDVEGVGPDTIGALPRDGLPFVVNLLVALGGDHFLRAGFEGLVVGKHGRGLVFVVRHARGDDVAVRGHAARLLVDRDAVGGSGAGGVPDACVLVQRDQVAGLFERGAMGGRAPFAFLVAEIVPLLHARELSGFGVEVGLEVLAPGQDGLRCLLWRGGIFRGRFGVCARGGIGRAEGLDDVAGAVRDEHAVGVERAMALARAVGQELEPARRERLDIVDLAAAGAHPEQHAFAVNYPRLGERHVLVRDGSRFHHGVARGERLAHFARAGTGVEGHVHAPAVDGGAARCR